jgi:hypothetical protein
MSTNTSLLGEPALKSRQPSRIRVRRAVPLPTSDEPSDEDLLRLIEGTLPKRRVRRVLERSAKSPYSRARLEVLLEALEETGFHLPDPPDDDTP